MASLFNIFLMSLSVCQSRKYQTDTLLSPSEQPHNLTTVVTAAFGLHRATAAPVSRKRSRQPPICVTDDIPNR